MKKNKVVECEDPEYKRVYLPDTSEEGTLANLLETVNREFPGIPPEHIWVHAGWCSENPSNPLTVWLQPMNTDYLNSIEGHTKQKNIPVCKDTGMEAVKFTLKRR